MRISREELYEKVWREPISRLAGSYGVSNVALAKRCRALNVPLPPRGHWAKIKHGKLSAQPPLPVATKGQVMYVDVAASKKHASMKNDPIVVARIEAEEKPENVVVVGERLTNPHSVVRATAAALSAAKPDEYGMLQSPRYRPGAMLEPMPLKMRVSPTMKMRALLVADALLKALEGRGYKLDPGSRPDPRRGDRGQQPAMIIEGERIPFLIEEKADRSDHVPTKAELADSARWFWRKPRKWDHTPCGKLSFQIDVRLYCTDGIRKRWSDSRGRGIEDSLNEIVIAFVEVAAAMRRRREQEAREEAERQKRVQLRQEEERLRKLELSRRKDLEASADSWNRAEALRRFVAEVDRRAQADPQGIASEIRDWLVWARAHADRLDPLSTGIDGLLRGQRTEEME